MVCSRISLMVRNVVAVVTVRMLVAHAISHVLQILIFFFRVAAKAHHSAAKSVPG